MDLKSTYNRIAEDWAKDHDKDTWWKRGTDFFLEMVPKNSTILDLGCGAGIKTKYIASKGFPVTGIDFSEKMIEIGKKSAPQLTFEVYDVYEIDKYPKTFDAVFAQAVLLHISKDRIMEVLKKIKSRLNKGGLLYVAVKGIKDNGIEQEIVKESDYGYEYERFFSYYSLSEFKKYTEELKMEIVWEDISSTGKSNWIQIIANKID